MAADVTARLSRVRSLQDETRHDELPGSLVEKMSEGNSLLYTLPGELEERFRYLESNKQLRLHYYELRDKLLKWIVDAERMVEKGRFGVDFENVLSDLEEHKVIFY